MEKLSPLLKSGIQQRPMITRRHIPDLELRCPFLTLAKRFPVGKNALKAAPLDFAVSNLPY